MQFQSFAYGSNYQIIGLSETWLTEILPQAHSVYRKDRCSCGGGVMIAISNNLPSRQIMSPDNLELVTVSVSLNDTVISTHSSTDQFKDLISYHTNDPILILSDFNLPDINWQTLSGNSVASDTFCEFIFNFNITQLVDIPIQINTVIF